MTTIEFDFSNDPNPYREAIPMRSRADAPECKPASQRASAEEVPPLHWSDCAVYEKPSGACDCGGVPPHWLDDGPSSARGLGWGFVIAGLSLAALIGLVLLRMS